MLALLSSHHHHCLAMQLASVAVTRPAHDLLTSEVYLTHQWGLTILTSEVWSYSPARLDLTRQRGLILLTSEVWSYSPARFDLSSVARTNHWTKVPGDSLACSQFLSALRTDSKRWFPASFLLRKVPESEAWNQCGLRTHHFTHAAAVCGYDMGVGCRKKTRNRQSGEQKKTRSRQSGEQKKTRVRQGLYA